MNQAILVLPFLGELKQVYINNLIFKIIKANLNNKEIVIGTKSITVYHTYVCTVFLILILEDYMKIVTN